MANTALIWDCPQGAATVRRREAEQAGSRGGCEVSVEAGQQLSESHVLPDAPTPSCGGSGWWRDRVPCSFSRAIPSDRFQVWPTGPVVSLVSCFVAPVHASVEGVRGAPAESRLPGRRAGPGVWGGALRGRPACCLQHGAPAQHGRFLPRLGLPVNGRAAVGDGGQLPQQRDRRLPEDGASPEPGPEQLRRRRVQLAGAVPVLHTAEGGRGRGRGQRQNRNPAAAFTSAFQRDGLALRSRPAGSSEGTSPRPRACSVETLALN